jgi:hypothetical protein
MPLVQWHRPRYPFPLLRLFLQTTISQLEAKRTPHVVQGHPQILRPNAGPPGTVFSI